MAHELIITSVRKGIDGGSGYQPVLRTRGMKQAVAERLQIRCGYAHPFPHGDRRNPRVFIHRIERVAGETLHVLAQICDAGSDHTGRSNFLAHLVAIQDAEARRTPAGPAAMAQRFAFKGSWSESPRESDPPALIGGDRSPAPCATWQAAGLDPGIAGDLAEAAANGSAVRLIVREGDDVLALFADALALVPPMKRWQVTFNTCEIEPFDAVWRAVREDLPQAKAVRGSAGVIDLTAAGLKGSQGIYARFARGEAVSLPWQVTATQTDSTTPAKETAAPTATGAATRRGAAVEPSDNPRSPLPPTTAARPETAPPPVRPGKRNLLETVAGPAATGAADGVESPRRRHLAANLAVSAFALLLLGGIGLVSYLLVAPGAIRSVATLFRSEQPPPDPSATAADSATEASLSAEGAQRQAEMEAEQRAEEDRRKQEADRAAERQRQEAENAAKAKADKEKADRAAEEKQRQEAEKAKADKEQKVAKERTEAFAELHKLPLIIPRDLPYPNTGVGGGTADLKPVDVGPLNVDRLLDLSFGLAVPKDTIGGDEFNAWVEQAKPGCHRWEILAKAAAGVVGDSPPILLATLQVQDGTLQITPSRKEILTNPRFNLLRRSVLLVKAKDPDTPEATPAVPRAIQLVQPKPTPNTFMVQLVRHNKDGGNAPFMGELQPPAGITAKAADGAAPALPLDGITIDYEVAFDYPPEGGEEKPVSHPGALQASTCESGTYFPLLKCPPSNPPDDTTIGVEVKVSLNEGKMKIQPTTAGPRMKAFDLSDEHFQKTVISTAGKDFDKDTDKEIASVRLTVSTFLTRKAVTFGKEDYARLLTFVKERGKQFRDFEGDFGSYFVRTKAFPDPNNPKQVCGDPAVCLTEWDKAIQGAAAKASEAEWEQAFTKRLKGWSDDWKPRYEEHRKRLHEAYAPLMSPVRVTVKKITAAAFDDGREYPVILSEFKAKNVDPVHSPYQKTDIK